MEVPNMPPSSGVPPNLCHSSCSRDTGMRGKKGGGSGGRGVVPARPVSSSANSSPTHTHPHPYPPQPVPLAPERTPNTGRGGEDKEAEGKGLPEPCGAGPSQTPGNHAGGQAGERSRKSPASSGPADGGASGRAARAASPGHRAAPPGGTAWPGAERPPRARPSGTADRTHPHSGLAARGSRWRGSQ